MSDNGDISRLLQDESTLADLDWLDVDENDYRDAEQLPKQNLDMVPDLQEQWGRISEEDRYALNPVNQEPEKRSTPFWSEKSMPSTISDAEKEEIVEQFLKRKMSAGMDFKAALSEVKNSFDMDTLRTASSVIKSAAEERGLLGFVYVDASLYPDCHQGGKGVDVVKKANKHARFVKAKDRCNDCRYAQNGRCSVFQKELVFDVQYDNSLWDFYKQKLESHGVDLSGIDDNKTAKAKLRVASFNGPTQSSSGLDSKPIQVHPADQVSAEEASERLKNADLTREVVKNVHRQKRRRRVAKKMLANEYSQEVVDELKQNPEMADLGKHRFLMGSLYADLSLFDSKEAVEEYQEQNPNLFFYRDASDFNIKQPDVLRQVLHRYAINQYGLDYGEKEETKSVISKVAKRLLQSDHDDVRAFARGVYSQPLPTDVKEYEYRSDAFYDPTGGLTEEEAERKFANYEKPEREVPTNTSREKVKSYLADRMAKGDHSKDVQQRIAAEGFEKDLGPHLNLLGKLYFDERLVNASDYDKNLPVLSSENEGHFFVLPEIQDRIIDRYIKVKNVGDSKYAKTASKMRGVLDGLSNKEAYKFARRIYGKPLPRKHRNYVPQGHSFEKSAVLDKQKLTREEVRDFYRRNRKRDTVDVSFNKLASRDKGLLRSLVSRIGKENVVALFGKDSGNIDSLEKQASLKTANKRIVKAALDPNFKSTYHSVPDPIYFRTKMGRWMRDKMQEGLYGERLVQAIRSSFDEDQISENAPIIIGMREQEGLYARAYSTANSYDDCYEGTQKVSKTVDQIVKGEKCSDCVYNKAGRCALYSKDLKEDPEYTEAAARRGLNHRLEKGELGRRAASQINDVTNLTPREKTRMAYAGSPGKKASVERYKEYQAFRGANTSVREDKAQKVLKVARAMIEKDKDFDLVCSALEKKFGSFVSGMKPYLKRIYNKRLEEQKTAEMLRQMNTNAPSGLDEMEEMDLVDSAVSSPLDDFDITEAQETEQVDGIVLEGITLD